MTGLPPGADVALLLLFGMAATVSIALVPLTAPRAQREALARWASHDPMGVVLCVIVVVFAGSTGGLALVTWLRTGHFEEWLVPLLAAFGVCAGSTATKLGSNVLLAEDLLYALGVDALSAVWAANLLYWGLGKVWHG